MVEIIQIEETRPSSIAERIRGGEVFIYPTDTVYGIGCDAFNKDSVRRIFRIKQRPRNKPLSVAFCDIDQLLRCVSLSSGQEALLRKRLPGPYTFIVMNRTIPKIVTGGLDTIGVRIPDYGLVRRIIREADTPIVTTSANISGERAPDSLHEISCDLLNRVDFVIDAGKCELGRPSEVIDLTTGRRLR